MLAYVSDKHLVLLICLCQQFIYSDLPALSLYWSKKEDTLKLILKVNSYIKNSKWVITPVSALA